MPSRTQSPERWWQCYRDILHILKLFGLSFETLNPICNYLESALIKTYFTVNTLNMEPATTIDSPMPVQPNERIQVLDVLRGIAILGMLVAHFDGHGTKESELNLIIGRGEELFIESRFYTLFAILFGAGFAIQLSRANNRNGSFVIRFLRRMFTLACFGFILWIAFGANIIYTYAICGLLLIPLRNWSTKALIITLFICAMLTPLSRITFATSYKALYGLEQFKTYSRQQGETERTLWFEQQNRNNIVNNTTNFITALKARTENFIAGQPNSINKLIGLLSDAFMLVLIGFIAFRLKLFEKPGEYRRLIISLMIFGILFWALTNWALPFFPMTPKISYPNVPFLVQGILFYLSKGFGLVRDYWLTFTYAGAVLLLISYNPIKWLNRFKFFTWPGRMALTNFILQTMLLDILFSKYAIELPKIPEVIVVFVFAPSLFIVLTLFSRWWLNRFQYGPLEWIWRCVTYWKKQPLRIKPNKITEQENL